jgi:hypothetical protein
MGSRLTLLALALAPHLLADCPNTPAYSTCELVFELSEKDAAANPNPYVSVDLRAEFRSPRHRTYMLPAYWDGGRRIVIRVSPVEAGDWDYRLTSNIAEWNGKTGTFTAAASEAPGFVRTANVHHWAYTERNLPHLWMGASELRFGFVDDAAFRAMADARASQKFNHVRGFIMAQPQDAAYTGPDAPDVQQFQRLDQRILYLNQKGITVDLILSAGAGAITRLFPGWEQRRRFMRYIAARYAAMNVTWQGVDVFEDYPDGRALLRELGGYLKEFDPYQHPRTTGARVTSSPLLDDGWMNFVAYETADDSVGAIEHQLFPVPFVNLDFGREGSDPAAFRKRLWNVTMDGQYPTYAAGDASLTSPGTKAMQAWWDVLSDTRHWELEPYFDIDGGRAVALEDADYLAYIEKPGPIEMLVQKHGYDVYWINPADGETIKSKFKGDHFTGTPPNNSHDWILRVVREGHVEGMNKSYKFESREIVLQEVESNSPKVPFEIEQPTGDISLAKPAAYSAKLTRESRATRSMMWMWTGEVAADKQGVRVLATGSKGAFPVPADIAKNYPAVMHLRLYGLNANGKLYARDAACGIAK